MLTQADPNSIPPVIGQGWWNLGRAGMVLSFATPAAIAAIVLMKPG